MAEIMEVLAKIRRYLALQQIRDKVVFWFAAGSGVGAAALCLSLFVPFYQAPVTAGVAFLAAVFAGILHGALTAPDQRKAARMADRTGLSERLITAWELRERDDLGSRLQREETKRILSDYPWKERLKRKTSRKQLGMITAFFCLGVIFYLFPTEAKERALLSHELAKAKQEAAEAQEEKIEELLSEWEKLAESGLLSDAELDKWQQEAARGLEEIREAISAEDLAEVLRRLEKKEEQQKNQFASNKGSNGNGNGSQGGNGQNGGQNGNGNNPGDGRNQNSQGENAGDGDGEKEAGDGTESGEDTGEGGNGQSGSGSSGNGSQGSGQSGTGTSQNNGSQNGDGQSGDGTGQSGESQSGSQSGTGNGQTGSGQGSNGQSGSQSGSSQGGQGSQNGNGQGGAGQSGSGNNPGGSSHGSQGSQGGSGSGSGAGWNYGSNVGIEREHESTLGQETIIMEGTVTDGENLTGTAGEGNAGTQGGFVYGEGYAGTEVEYGKVVSDYAGKAYSQIEKNEIPSAMQEVVKKYFEGLTK